MKDWLFAIQLGIYRQRYALAAMLISVGTWLLVGSLVPSGILDMFVYAIFGWYWLGAVVVPWIETKLEKLFS